MSEPTDYQPSSAALRVRQVELRPDDDFQRRREKLARIVLDEMYQFVALLDAAGTLLEVNRAALEGGGIRLEDIENRPFWEAHWWTLSSATQERLRAAILRAADGEFVRYDAEVYGGAAGSETIIIDFSLIPVRDTGGRVVFLLAEGRNITEKKRAEAEIARKNQELEGLLQRIRELDELKSQFFANVSHELRTPLALILGPAEAMLAGGDNLTEAQRRDLGVIRRNAATLLKHVNDLLDVSKLDAGKMGVRYAEVDLAQLVRLVAGHFEALASQRDVTFQVDVPGRLVAQVDPDKLERVVLNLLSNAFKFVPAGGRVRVSLQPTEAGRALLHVQDSGPGVRPELRGVIFERFRQGEGSSTRKFGGTGLGLAIAKDFVALHGGTITVTDAPGGGALFLVEVPLLAPGSPQVLSFSEASPARESDAVLQGTLEELRPVAEPAVEERGAEGRPRVLVVEDNPELNRFLAEGLSRDFHVETAANGREGLQKALARPPDLIVTDIMMPEMSGDELVREARRRGELEAVPILVLSAKADDELRIRLLREGAQDYVVKPFSVDEVRARASNLVRVKRTRVLLQEELDTHQQDIELLAREVTVRKRELATALETMRLARDEARRSNEVKGTFLSLVSHELRTPLTVIQLELTRLEREKGEALTEKQRARVRKVRESSRRLLGLVESLLDYTGLETDRLQVHLAPVDVTALAREVLEELQQRAEAKTLTLRTDLQSGLCTRTDIRLLRLVLVNLLDNAIKFTEAGAVEVALRRDAEVLRLSVRDTGCGIPPEAHARIFEPFEQLEPTRSKHTPGVGLGLALVKRMVEALGGTIELASSPGAGSTFSVSLPDRPCQSLAS
ncbi:MAG TPA: ATP-binding protein [Myxococcus sp.]|nr:ATP-binding protein [Myxococcus sp.]